MPKGGMKRYSKDGSTIAITIVQSRFDATAEDWLWRSSAETLRVCRRNSISKSQWEALVKKTLKVGDHVTWNSEAGHVSGRIIKVHTTDVDYKGYTHHATRDDPQYEIKSNTTDHIAMHKGDALKRIAAK